MTKTRTQLAIALAAAAAVLAVVLTVPPHATIVANEASDAIHGIDILAISKNVKDLPEQQYDAH